MLTEKQYELWVFIHKYQMDHGGVVSPNYEEMAEGIGINSKSGVYRLLSALVERGFIKKLGGMGRARTIELLKVPEKTLDDQIVELLGEHAPGYQAGAVMKEIPLLDYVCNKLVEHIKWQEETHR